MRLETTLIGHKHQRHALAQLAANEKLPSSLIFCGPEGVGKRLVALELAARIMCLKNQGTTLNTQTAPHEACGTCPSCQLIAVGNHPDLNTLDWGTEDGVAVNDIRSSLESIGLRTLIGTKRVTILNDVDHISVIGANILLKTLEEPRPESFFILVATTSSRLPQTVLSRCQRWFFDRLSNSELAQILTNRGATQEELALVPFADGSCVLLERVKADGAIGEEIKITLDAALRGDTAEIAKTAQSWGANKDTIKDRLILLRSAIRDRLLASASDPHLAAVWAHGLQNAIDAEYLILDRHVNATLTVLEVLQSCSYDRGLGYRITPNLSAPMLEGIIR
jgi:DNA polymerase III delta prime subunit